MSDDGDNQSGEKGFLRCAVSFDIDGHKVEASHSYDYESCPGNGPMGWVFGIGVATVLLSLRRYLTLGQWQDFYDAILSEFAEAENE